MEGGFQELLDEFLLEARERADEVEILLLQLTTGDPESRQTTIGRAKRELHTLKGNSGMMGFSDLQQIAHSMEDLVEEIDLSAPKIDAVLGQLDQLRQGLEAVRSPFEDGGDIDSAASAPSVETNLLDTPSAELGGETGIVDSGGRLDPGGSVRVSFSKIDQLVETQAETLIHRNRLADALERLRGLLAHADNLPDDLREPLAHSFEDLETSRETLEKTLDHLQQQVTELGMVPLQSLFRSLGRVVHDESRREAKQVDLSIEGGDTPIDRTLLEAAGDALGHLVRNAVIHGIESPEARRAFGKPETGRVRVSATLEAGEVRIEVSDDGGGIDEHALIEKARRVAPELAAMATGFELLFQDGISTREDTGLGAGRGVGLSAVQKSVERHGGRIKIRSELGLGTSFTLHLPVTASILRCLLVAVDDEEYALPLTAVAESLHLAPAAIHEMNQVPVLRWRRRVVPIIDLGRIFGTFEGVLRAEGFVVLVEVNGRFRGLVIDRLVGIRDIVVKGLDGIVGNPTGISGSTILGDGRVIMILDPASLASLSPTIASRA